MSHIHLSLDVDFEHNILNGNAILSVEKVLDSATEVLLDVRGLTIRSINDDSTGQVLKYTVHPEGYVGSKLEVQLPSSKDKMY